MEFHLTTKAVLVSQLPQTAGCIYGGIGIAKLGRRIGGGVKIYQQHVPGQTAEPD